MVTVIVIPNNNTSKEIVSQQSVLNNIPDCMKIKLTIIEVGNVNGIMNELRIQTQRSGIGEGGQDVMDFWPIASLAISPTSLKG